MHKIVKVATVGSVGDLGRISRALANGGYNIAAVGGGEAPIDDHEVGIITLAIADDEDQDDEIVEVIQNVDLGGGRHPVSVEAHPALVLELENTPGRLADAAEEIGRQGHNIMGALLIDIFDPIAHVGLGFESEAIRNLAREALVAAGFTVLDEHGA